MEPERLANIEELLRVMRQENAAFASKTPPDSPLHEEEEVAILPSRYRQQTPSVIENKENFRDSSSESEGAGTPTHMPNNVNVVGIHKRKTKLGPPVRMPKQPISRPTTAQVRTAPRANKRHDPVSLYQQRQADWKASSFLKSGSNLKEGRKLNLNRRYVPPKAMRNSHNPMRPTYVAPHEKRRDEVRFETRMKFL